MQDAQAIAKLVDDPGSLIIRTADYLDDHAVEVFSEIVENPAQLQSFIGAQGSKKNQAAGHFLSLLLDRGEEGKALVGKALATPGVALSLINPGHGDPDARLLMRLMLAVKPEDQLRITQLEELQSTMQYCEGQRWGQLQRDLARRFAGPTTNKIGPAAISLK